MTTDTSEPIRDIQRALEILGHSPGTIDGRWGLGTARALKSLLADNGRAASLMPPGVLPWISEAKTALGRHEARDRPAPPAAPANDATRRIPFHHQ